MRPLCKIDGCNKRHESLGWCKAHYRRWLAHGDPIGGGTAMGEAQRYFSETVLTYEGDQCLAWPYSRNARGYGKLWLDGRTRIVSRMVCEHINGPPPTVGHEAAHSCGRGDEGCVAKSHLFWKTRSGNQCDRIIHGTHSRGDRNGNSKLTEREVLKIIALKGTKSQREIAAQFGVSCQHIHQIHHGERWGWLGKEKAG